MANLIILVGLPGSGKSSYAKQVFPHKTIVSSDEIRTRMFSALDDSEGGAHEAKAKEPNNSLVFGVFHQEIADALANDLDTVADATSLNFSARQKLRDIAAAYDAATHVIFFTNVAQAMLRNTVRSGDRRVPEGAMMTMLSKYLDTLATIGNEQYTSIIKVESYG